MKKILPLFMTAVLLLSLAACAKQNASTSESTPPPSASAASGSQTEPVPEDDAGESDGEEGSRILIAYFTRLDNTDATLEEILQGGGPYGSLGSSLEDADVDAIASASITLVDDEARGNVETLAQMIQSATDGELFSIQTVASYPVDYDTLIDQGGDEKSRDVRPELATRVESMEDYDVVFIGFPNWWYDMPMAVYSFLETYDFSGKTVVPFASSAGSGFSGAIETLTELLPGANVIENGLHIPMGDVYGAQTEVESWIAEMGELQ